MFWILRDQVIEGVRETISGTLAVKVVVSLDADGIITGEETSKEGVLTFSGRLIAPGLIDGTLRDQQFNTCGNFLLKSSVDGCEGSLTRLVSEGFVTETYKWFIPENTIAEGTTE